MSVFTQAVSGANTRRSFFPVKERFTGDIPIGRVIPEYCDFCVPGDIWHLKQLCFMRTQPMLAPLLTDLDARVRAWFVPLRQIEENAELIITGSKNGKFDPELVLPKFAGMFDDVPAAGTTAYDVDKYSALDYMMAAPIGNYKKIKDDKAIMSQYWLKGYEKIWFDWYRDENLSSFDDFDDFWDTIKVAPGKVEPFYANWRKDYFMSLLPFQQKGIRPTFDFNLVNPDDFSTFFGLNAVKYSKQASAYSAISNNGTFSAFPIKNTSGSSVTPDNVNGSFYRVDGENVSFNNITQGIDFQGLASTLGVDDLRIVTQTQKIMERLARCGSRRLAPVASSPSGESVRGPSYKTIHRIFTCNIRYCTGRRNFATC